MEKKKIDNLIKSNIKDQLKNFDWDHLHAKISQKIDSARPTRKRTPIFKISAAVTAAAILIIAFIIYTNLKPDNNSKSPKNNQPTGKWMVKLSDPTVKCTVTMLDTNGSTQKETDTTKQISIIKTYPKQQADPLTDNDMTDLACLL